MKGAAFIVVRRAGARTCDMAHDRAHTLAGLRAPSAFIRYMCMYVYVISKKSRLRRSFRNRPSTQRVGSSFLKPRWDPGQQVALGFYKVISKARIITVYFIKYRSSFNGVDKNNGQLDGAVLDDGGSSGGGLPSTVFAWCRHAIMELWPLPA